MGSRDIPSAPVEHRAGGTPDACYNAPPNAAVLVDHLPNYAGSPDDLATYLATLGGPTVAPESDYTERIERRRQRRRAKAERLVAAAFPLAVAMSKEMAVELATERLYCTDCYQRRKRR